MKRILLILLFFGAFAAAHAGVIYVASDAAPGGDGGTWGSAFSSLQDALDAADPNDVDGIDQIWVKAGTYYPTRDILGRPQGVDLFNPGSNIYQADLTFSITQSVEVYGGFDGTEATLSERDITDNVTILSGDFDPLLDSDNANRVVWIQDLSGNILSNVVLDGLTVTGGTDRGNVGGGGIYTINTDPITFRNLTVSDCSAVEDGGGIFIYAPNVINLEGVTVQNCTAGIRGGGIFLQNTSQTAILNIEGLYLLNNSAGNDGGGAYLRVLSACEITNALIVNNTSGADGGGIGVRGRNSVGSINIELTHTTFYGNTAPSGYGGGLFTEVSAGVQIYNSIFYANSDETGTTTSTSQLGRASNSINQIAHTLIQGSGGSGAGWMLNTDDDMGNNGDFDPLFVDPDGADNILGNEDDNFSLSALSPANNLGTTSIPNLSAYPTTDLVGAARTQSTAPDLGAFEGPFGVSFPVEWLSFSGEWSADGAHLQWQTAQEILTSHFEVERAVNDLHSWEYIGRVSAVGSSNEVQTYRLLDREANGLPTTGNVYYRIKQVDLDGQFSHSEVLSLRPHAPIAAPATVGLYPNPARFQSTLDISFSRVPTTGTVCIRSHTGQAVWQQAFVPAAVQKISLPVEEFPAGMYWVEIVYDGQRASQKLQIGR